MKSMNIWSLMGINTALHCLFLSLRERSFVVGSFGKTFHVTGWKTGYCAAAPALMQLFRQAYQFINFCGVSAVQVALANYMQQHPEHIAELAKFYQDKRDLFNQGIANITLSMVSPAQGNLFSKSQITAISVPT